MSLASVREFLAQRAPDIPVIEMETSTATVALAAAAHGVAPGQIAKTLSLRVGAAVLLVVLGGDVRMDNKKLQNGRATSRERVCQFVKIAVVADSLKNKT